MLTRHTRNGVTWIDLEAPTREELRTIMDEFDIDERVEEEIVSPTPYPLVLSSSRYVYLILHFPVANPEGGARNQEIDFIVGKKFLITARYEVVEAIHSLQRAFEAEELLNLPNKTVSAEALIGRVLRQVYGAIREQVEQVARTLERIEDGIFADKEREMVPAISMVGRVLLRFDTTLARHADPLKAFLEELSEPSFFGKSFDVHVAQIQAEHDHTAALVSSYRAVATELRNTNESLLSAAENETIKRLTLMSVPLFLLSSIIGLFAIESESVPFANSPHFFWFVLLIMALALVALLLFFRYKKWF